MIPASQKVTLFIDGKPAKKVPAYSIKEGDKIGTPHGFARVAKIFNSESALVQVNVDDPRIGNTIIVSIESSLATIGDKRLVVKECIETQDMRVVKNEMLFWTPLEYKLLSKRSKTVGFTLVNADKFYGDNGTLFFAEDIIEEEDESLAIERELRNSKKDIATFQSKSKDVDTPPHK